MDSQLPPFGTDGAPEHGVGQKNLVVDGGDDAAPATEERSRLGSIGPLDLDLDLDGNSVATSALNMPQTSLQDQLAHLDLSLHDLLHESVPAHTPIATSRRPSDVVHEAAHEEILDQRHGVDVYHEDEYVQPEDIMDISESADLAFQPALNEFNADMAAESDGPVPSSLLSQSSTPESFDEEPCRPHPDSNHDMSYFLGFWRFSYEHNNVSEPINLEAWHARNWERPSLVSNIDVAGGFDDIQGIDWSRLGATREGARSVRKLYHQHPKVWQHPTPESAAPLADSEQIFQFRQMNMNHRAWIDHYQLRNIMISTSHSDVYYVTRSKIMHTNPSSPRASCVMDLTDPATDSIPSGGFRVTALTSTDNMLIAGGFRGDYALQNLRSEYGTSPEKGFVTRDLGAMTNHLHTSTSRTTGLPQAIFCSNDRYVRALDCNSNTFINEYQYEDSINCAATSPNGRLRVLVGDFQGSIIVDADSGRPLERLGGSTTNAFACAWADDDRHVATAAEDCHILIWDARNWSRPVADIANELSHTTSLHFSPVGSGKRLLIAAEAADVVNVIDADTYSRKQVLSFFGDIAGTSLTADGSQLIVANADRKFGGLITYQRADYGNNDGRDWLPEYGPGSDPRCRLSAKSRSRRGLGLDELEI